MYRGDAGGAMTEPVTTASAVTLAEKVRSGDLSPVEVVDAYLERIDERDEALGAYVTVLEERARSAAVEQTEQLAEGTDPGPLAGVPLGVKDIVDVAGVPTTQGTSLLADNTAESDDPGVARLREEGSLVIGKSRSPSFDSETWFSATDRESRPGE